MIIYFSATGNSKHVALKIAEIVGDEALDLFERIKKKDRSPLSSERPWVLVCPTYAWQIPHIVRDWLIKTPLNGSKKLYTVMTCGDSIGTAGKRVEKICLQKGLEFCGCKKIVMPENYVAMFECPPDEKAKKIISAAEPLIAECAAVVGENRPFEQKDNNLFDKLSSDIVNPIFYKLFVKAKPFRVTDKCISCGHCEKVCPLGNVKLADGKPVWGENCTHCMACICTCPKEAVEYGKKTMGKVRYQFPLK